MNQKEEIYDRYTFNSSNPLARFSHRSRYKVGVKLIKKEKNLRILDFGCGDGRFLNDLEIEKQDFILVGFDPYMESVLFKNITIHKEWQKIKELTKSKGLFDYVVCFEVLEHFSKVRQMNALEQIAGVIKEDGYFVVSVPIEKGFPSVVKNLRRMMIHPNGNIYNFKNIIASLFGVKTKWMKQHRLGAEYLSHIGFFFNELEFVMKHFFTIKKKIYSPFKGLGSNFNAQVFYVLKKK
ncbi:class I SAM-dependent methyltransferase [Flavobacteriaceae bacterium]|jgi:2-polyprenyl-3-methyl-5-hydroxy-6-metoxy-1,4-benzoquinol methylase|nr:class I SAM-dependent methyltransferase [Flavobacteriaceae bacterium]